MTGREILTTHSYLENLKAKKLPARLSMAISVNAEELGKWAGKIEEQRIRLLEGYAEKDEGGKPIIDDKNGRKFYRITDEATAAFTEEYMAFLGENMPDVKVIKVDGSELAVQLEDPRYDALTVAEFDAMRFMIS